MHALLPRPAPPRSAPTSLPALAGPRLGSRKWLCHRPASEQLGDQVIRLPTGVTKMSVMLIIWTSWAGPATRRLVGLWKPAVINILPGVIPIAPPRRGSHPVQEPRGNCPGCIPGAALDHGHPGSARWRAGDALSLAPGWDAPARRSTTLTPAPPRQSPAWELGRGPKLTLDLPQGPPLGVKSRPWPCEDPRREGTGRGGSPFPHPQFHCIGTGKM